MCLLEQKGGDDQLVEYFHAHVDKTSEVDVPQEVAHGQCRCLITTIVFGMGIQVDEIAFVIHWGPPKNVLNYFQEIGRCARSGGEGHAILYKPPNTVRSDRIEKSMLDIVNDHMSCIRYSALKQLKLAALSDEDLKAHCFGKECCSYCDTKLY